MRTIKDHLALKKTRFICRDTSEQHELIVPLTHAVGSPAKSTDLDKLQRIAGSEAEWLLPLYSEFNGIIFHRHGDTAGLVVASIEQLEQINSEWRAWFQDYLEPDEQYDFQQEGFAFACIADSDNYFVVYKGKVYYSEHDGGDDRVWGENLELFFKRALSDPALFLFDAGCCTRYSDGQTDRQFIPEVFVHD